MATKIQPLQELIKQSDAELLKQCVGEMSQIYLDKSVGSKPIDPTIVTAAGKILLPIVREASTKIGALMETLGQALDLLSEIELTPDQKAKLDGITIAAQAEL